MYYCTTIQDDSKLLKKIRQILEKNSIIIFTVAILMGRYIFILDSLRKLGVKILFHKIAIHQNKPVLYAYFFCKAYVSVSHNKKLQLQILLKAQKSFKNAPLIRKNCWVIFLQKQTNIQEKESIDFNPFTPGI